MVCASLRDAFDPVGSKRNGIKGGMIIAIYHLSIKIISRGKGKSAVAAAAYRSAEKITNDYDGITHDYTKKGGVVHTQIILPENAPPEYADRSILWNAVEKIEKSKNSQLAREVELALPVELSLKQNIYLVREYCRKHFVSAGMIADFAIHDNKNGNPHAHILLTTRPFNEDKSWGSKQRKEYILDSNGDKIYDKKKRQYKCKSVPSTDWNEQSKAEEWRTAWEDSVNTAFEEHGVDSRIDYRSYKRQGIDKIPTVHLGVSASQMERKGISTERGNHNRMVANFNRELRQLRARIVKLDKWIKSESTNTTPPTLYDVIQNILSRQETQKYRNFNLKAASQALLFLQRNNISDIAGLENKIKSMYSNQSEIRNKMKPIKRRLKTLDEHIKQSNYYFEFKGIYQKYQSIKPKYQADFYENNRREITLYESAKTYLDGVMNGHTKIPRKSWGIECERSTVEKDMLYREYCLLKTEVQEVEKIKRSVYDLIKVNERQGQPQKSWDMER